MRKIVPITASPTAPPISWRVTSVPDATPVKWRGIAEIPIEVPGPELSPQPIPKSPKKASSMGGAERGVIKTFKISEADTMRNPVMMRDFFERRSEILPVIWDITVKVTVSIKRKRPDLPGVIFWIF